MIKTYWKLLKPTPGNGFVCSLLTWHPLVIVPVLLGVAEFPSSSAQMRAHWKLVFGAVHLSTAVARSSAPPAQQQVCEGLPALFRHLL